MTIAARSPNPTDIFVGSRIRLRRNMLGMSQERLASQLGVTFQQVQKYEKGTNRVGASRLQTIAGILGVPVGFFFQQDQSRLSLEGIEVPADEGAITEFLVTRQGILLNQAYLKIKDAKIRRSIIALVKVLAAGQDGSSRSEDDDFDKRDTRA